MRSFLRFRVLRSLAASLPAFYLAAFAALASEPDVPRLLADAEKGDLPAEMNLAAAYQNGSGTPQDYPKALHWYLKAAEQGNAGAVAQVGYFYERGKGVKKDAALAMEWYKKSADLAKKTHQQNFADGYILRLSRSGAIKEKYAGIPYEGGLLLVKLDETTPLPTLLQDLQAHPKEIETGKAYWIGYNAQMIAVAARGDEAVAPLTDLIKSAIDPRVRRAGLLTLHLVGIGGDVAGRFTEDFTNRTAREALWKLMALEGLTDEVVDLLKRDPWPADVPAIMDALARVKGDCPRTLNALARYPIPPRRRPFDNLGQTGWGGVTVRCTIPKTYTDREYARIAIEGIKEAFPGKVEVEEGLLDQIPVDSTSGTDTAKEWTGSLDELLASVKDLRPPFDYTSPGRGVYYFAEGIAYDEDHSTSLHFCSATTAKQRLLEWWQSTGRQWYCF